MKSNLSAVALTLLLAVPLAAFAADASSQENGPGPPSAPDPPHAFGGRAAAPHAGWTAPHTGAGVAPPPRGVAVPAPAGIGVAPPPSRAPAWGGGQPPYGRPAPPLARGPAGVSPHWREGHWWRGTHHGRFGAWWIVGPSWFWFPAEIYPYWEPYSYLEPEPYMMPGLAPGYWYWCEAYQQYYPYVGDCPLGWVPVPPY